MPPAGPGRVLLLEVLRVMDEDGRIAGESVAGEALRLDAVRLGA
jgi:hypothetical protein